MKFIIALFLTVPSIAFAQKVSFLTQTDSTFATIQGYGGKDFITNEGYISYNTVIKAYYHDEELNTYLAEKMEALNIPLLKARETTQEELVKQERSIKLDNEIQDEFPLSSNAISSAQLEDLEKRIESFRSQRNSGFSAQAVGVGLTAVGIATASSEILILGTVVNAIGWIVNWLAGDNLRRGKG